MPQYFDDMVLLIFQLTYSYYWFNLLFSNKTTEHTQIKIGVLIIGKEMRFNSHLHLKENHYFLL